MDISYLQTSSRNGCIHTAVDTLAHLIESHLNANTTEYSRFYSEMGLRTWAKVKDRLLRYEIGEEERGPLMNACTLRNRDHPYGNQPAPWAQLYGHL